MVKRDGSREEFSREKVLSGMILACHKRPIPMDKLRASAEAVEREVFERFEDEVPWDAIGEMVMSQLRDLDTVAYVRFASVYREFATVSDFRDLVETCR